VKIGILRMNQGPKLAVNGNGTGKMCKVYASISISRANSCMPCSSPHHHAYANLPQVDFSGQYWMDVFEPALREVKDRLMPNPNVW